MQLKEDLFNVKDSGYCAKVYKCNMFSGYKE